MVLFSWRDIFVAERKDVAERKEWLIDGFRILIYCLTLNL
jgi:hypothetical protein